MADDAIDEDVFAADATTATGASVEDVAFDDGTSTADEATTVVAFTADEAVAVTLSAEDAAAEVLKNTTFEVSGPARRAAPALHVRPLGPNAPALHVWPCWTPRTATPPPHAGPPHAAIWP